MENSILEAKKVCFCYQNSIWALQPTSLALKPGELVALIGPNGAGKSTLIKILAGVIHPTKGEVYLQGERISHFPRKKFAQKIGYLPQFIASHPEYTVSEVASLGRYAHSQGMGFLNQEDKHIIETCLKTCQVDQLSKRKINQLSGGERQRVFLASVLAQQPQVLLLDEPTTGLDFHHQIDLIELLKKLSQQGISVVFVTHEINLASIYAPRIVLFSKGMLLEDDTPNNVLQTSVLKDLYENKVFRGKHPQKDIPMIFPNLEL